MVIRSNYFQDRLNIVVILDPGRTLQGNETY